MEVGTLAADDPASHFGRARAGEAVVLHGLADAGVLSPVQAGEEYRRPLRLASRAPGRGC